MRRPFASWSRTFTALGYQSKKRRKKQTRRRGRESRLEQLEGRLLLAANWEPGLYVVDTAIDEDDGDYSLGDRSLREALSLATGSVNHRIEFDPSLIGATIRLDSELHPAGNVEIVGLGSDELTIDAQGTASSPQRAWMLDASLSVSLSGMTITGGYEDHGAGIYAEQVDLELSDVVLRHNQATVEGGGIYQLDGQLNIYDTTIARNTAQFGGGIYASLSGTETLFLTRTSVLHNVAEHPSLDSAGGGIFVAGQPTGSETSAGGLLLFESTIAYNSSPVGAANTTHSTGGVHLDRVDYMEIVHSTISNNTAADTSGGLAIADSGNVELINSTIAFNEVTGTGSGGLSVTGSSAIDAANTIVAENLANGSSSDVVGVFLATSTRNLLSSGSDPGGSNNTVLLPTETVGIAPLADNGGATLTHALLASSPAVDGGSDSRTYDPTFSGIKDQRGQRRYVNYVPGPTAGIVDIGGFELQPLIVATADFNGDGRNDQLFFDAATGDLNLTSDRGSTHESSSWGKLLPPAGGANWTKFHAGDFDGDGRDDLAAYNATSGEWTFAISDGTLFVLNHLQLSTGDDNWQIDSVGDFDADGADELIGRTHLSGGWQVLHFDPETGGVIENWGASFGGYNDWTLFVGDIDQDGRDDIVGRRPFVPGNWYAVRSQASTTGTGNFSSGLALAKSLDPYFQEGNFTVADFDAEFHREFADDLNSIDVEGPYREVLELFSQVYNEIETKYYWGLKKGPQATRETKAGNSWDQAALLVEDLLAAGFQAEIVTGKVVIPEQEAKDWIGTFTAEAAAAVLLTGGDNTASILNTSEGKFVSHRHAWVRVSLPTSTGVDWVGLDPSWKFKNRQPGIEVELTSPQGAFDEFAYFADDGDQLPIEWYEDQVAAHLSSNGIHASLAEVPYDGPIRQKVFHSVPYNNRLKDATNVEIAGTFTEIVANDPREYAHQVRIRINNWIRDIVVPESALSTFAFVRDSSSFTFYVDGAAEATIGVPAGGAELEITHTVPDQSFASSGEVYTYLFDEGVVGKTYALALEAGQHSTTSLDRLRADLNDSVTNGVGPGDITNVLEYVGARYWYQVRRYGEQAGDLMHSAVVAPEVGAAVISAESSLEAGSVNHLQTPIVPEGLTISAKKIEMQLLDLRYDEAVVSQLANTEASELAYFTSSALEHSTIEEVINTPSVSTIRGLIDAYQGDPFAIGLPSNSVFLLDSVLEGANRKVYVRGEVGDRAAENGHVPYNPNRTDLEITSEQALRDYFPEHRLDPSAPNDAQNNPSITDLWKRITEDIEGDGHALVPWTHSYVGDSQQYWQGSVYLVDKESTSTDNDAGYLISGNNNGPPLSGGGSSGFISSLSQLITSGANYFRNFVGDPVDVLNGNMFRDETDIVMPNIGVPLDFSRHYNSQSEYNVGLGIGWTHSFSDRLLQETGNADELIWLTSEGVRHTFTKTGSAWNSPAELFGELQEISGGYIYLDSDGVEHHFATTASEAASSTHDYIARLSKIVNQDDNGVELQYANTNAPFLPTRVRDVHFASRRLDMVLSGGNHIALIRKYSTGLQGTWNYEVENGGTRLKEVTNPEQDITRYEYHGSGPSQNLISRIVEADGAYHAYEYYPNGRTFRVKEGVHDGTNYVEESSHSFSYDIYRNLTEFVDENGNIETYIHQDDGRLARHIHADRSRIVTTWGVDDGAGGIIADTELLMASQVDEQGAIQTFDYFTGETGANAFKNRRLKSSTSAHFSGESSLTTEYDYEQASNHPHIVNIASVSAAPGTVDERTTIFQHDAVGRVVQVTNPLNEVTQFAYFPDNHSTNYLRGLRESETRPGITGSSSTIETAFTYDKAGLLTSTTTDSHPANSVTYHHTGQPATITDPTGVSILYTYDTLGRPTSIAQLGNVADPTDDLVDSYTYDEQGRVLQSVDPLGRSTTWSYDRRGNVVEQINPDGSQTSHEYDSVGNRIATIDALGRETRFAYDNRNRLAQIVHPDESTEWIRYNGTGQVASSIDALGNETRLEHNALGTESAMTTAYGTNVVSTTNYSYNLFNELIQTVDANGGVTQQVTDKLGRVTKTQVLNSLDSSNPAAPIYTPVLVTTRDYDADGNVTQIVTYDVAELSAETATLLSSDPRGLISTHTQNVQVTQTNYNVFQRPTETIYADGSSIRTEYDDAGRVRFEYNELNRVTEHRHDEFGKLVETIEPDPDGPSNPLTGPVTSYQYDAAGNETSITDPLGNVTRFEYDALNRVVATFDAEGGKQSALYDAAGQLVATIDALGRATYTQFDKGGRATLVRTPDPDGDGPQQASATRSTFDAAGNLVEETDARGFKLRYEYDAQHRLRRTIEHEQFELTATVDDGDPDFRVVTDTYPIEFQTVGYGGDSQFVTVPTAQNKATARWNFLSLEPGTYRVLATWEARPEATTNLSATISDAIPNLVVAGFDQTQTPSDVTRTENGTTTHWSVIVDEVEITATSSQNLKVVLSSEQGSNLIADAVRLERVIQHRYNYDDSGNLVASIDPLGRQTDYSYDELDRLKTTTLPDPDGTTGPLPRPLTTHYYDGYGNTTLTVEHRGGQDRERAATYDARNRMLTETLDANAASSEEATTQYGYDVAGNLVHQIEASGTPEQQVTQYRYDRLDRLISQWYHSDETVLSDWQQAVISQYDAADNLISQIDRVRHDDGGQTLYRSSVTEFAYDKLNREISATRDANGSLATTSYQRYDAVDNLIQSTDALGQVTRQEYDRLNRHIKTTTPDPDGSITSLAGAERTYIYDADGNLLTETNGEGETKRFVYDHRGRQISAFDALNAETRSVYDTADNLIAYIDPEGNQTSYTFDGLDRVLSESINLGGINVSRTFTYNAEENLAETTDRNGRTKTFEYDRLDRRRFERWLDASSNIINTLEWQYDTLGRPVLRQDGNTVETFDYDILDRVTVARNYDPAEPTSAHPRIELRWAYDLLDATDADDFVRIEYSQHQIDQGVQLGQTTSVFDRLGRTTQLVDTAGTNAAKIFDLTYDAADQLTSSQRSVAGSGFEFDTAYQYDPAGRVTSLSHTSQNATTPFTDYSYQYDQANRLKQRSVDTDTSIAALSQLPATHVENFSFDDAGQLIADASSTYAYDDNGNRTDSSFVTSTHNRLTEDAGFTYTYDTEGNRIRRDSKFDNSHTVYTWDHRNRLTQVEEFDAANQPSGTVDYRYDADNQLVAKTIGGVVTHYISDTDQRVLELADNGNLSRRSTWGLEVDQLLVDEAFDSNGQLHQTLWAATDRSGSVRQLLDSSASVVEHREFDSFGTLDQAFNASGALITASQLQSDIAFAGKHFDSDANLQYNNARWYDPKVGRFLNEDPTGFARNGLRYAYGRNS